jgi:hypothetical protein
VTFSLLLTVTFVCSCGGGVWSRGGLESKGFERVPTQQSSPKRPSGDEIRVSLDRIGPKSGKVRVENVSTEEVYLTYVPNADGMEAEFALLGLEKRNPVTGEFEPSEGTHFLPISKGLAPGSSFYYEFSVDSHGEYRVNIRYLIDKEWNERKTAMPLLDRDQILKELGEFESQIDNLIGTVTEGPIVL